MSLFSKCLMAAALVSLGTCTSYAAEEGVSPTTTDTRGSVMSRARPGYDAVGIHTGAFTIYPEANVSSKYDDNIYATSTNTKSDFITALSSSVSVNSNWNVHALNFSAGVTKSLYSKHSGENRLDWNVGANGRLDVTRNTKINAALSFQKLHEDRGDPSAPSASSEPVPYTLLSGSLGVDQRFNRMTASLIGDYSEYNYDNVVSTTGTPINQDFRDRKEYGETLKVGYDVSPDTSVYLRGTLNQRKYDQHPPVVAVNQDSKGYEIVAGTSIRLSNLMQGGFYLGYQSQSYDSSALSDINGLAYGGNIEWYLTPLMTVTLNADSAINETTLGGSGYLAQSVGLRVDHELLRNLLLHANVGYENDKYTGISRTDDILSAGLGADYLLSRNFSISLGYNYINRSSSVLGGDYSRNLFGLTLTGKL